MLKNCCFARPGPCKTVVFECFEHNGDFYSVGRVGGRTFMIFWRFYGGFWCFLDAFLCVFGGFLVVFNGFRWVLGFFHGFWQHFDVNQPAILVSRCNFCAIFFMGLQP